MMGFHHSTKPKVSSEAYTQTAVDVRTAARALWMAVVEAGAPSPEGWEGKSYDEWISLDRHRARVRAYAAGFATPKVRAAERAYDQSLNVCIRKNMGLIHKVAHKFRLQAALRGMEQDELIQDGSLGMQRALETFDPEKKVSFATYAYYWIYQSISRAIKNTGTIRVPIRIQDIAAKEKNGPLAVTKLKSLDSPLAHDPDETLMDTMSSPLISPEDQAQQKQDQERLEAALARLTDRERLVIQGRYLEEKTLEEVGIPLGVTRERARQIEASAIYKLKTFYLRKRVDFNG